MYKYILKRQKITKKRNAVIFCRNLLDIHDFKRIGDTWTFEENFSYHGIKCSFRFIVHSDDILSIYEINAKAMKVRGRPYSFSLILTLRDQELPINVHKQIGCGECYLTYSGRQLFYDENIKGKGGYGGRIKGGKKTSVPIPNSVSWSARHPFRGGGVSPK